MQINFYGGIRYCRYVCRMFNIRCISYTSHDSNDQKLQLAKFNILIIIKLICIFAIEFKAIFSFE